MRIGTCSWADDALSKHWYPPGTPPKERLAYYAERYSTVEVDSTYYRVPSEQMVRGWAERTPSGFVMHVKAFGLMTRHPVKLEQVPPDLREGLPVDARGRVDRPDRAARGAVFREFLDALSPLREAGKLGGILFQMPPYVVWKRSSLDYLEWAREQVGADAFLFEPRHRSWYAEDIRAELLRFLEERAMTWVVVDAPKVEAGNVPGDAGRDDDAARLRPLPRQEREHLERAWRLGRAALRPSLRRGGAARVGTAAPRAVERSRGGLRLLQQQQPDERRRPGAGRCAAAAETARRGEDPHRLMRVLAVTHGPLVRPELFADVIAEDGHELQEWDIRLQGAPPREFDAVMVFGGDQNVGDEVLHPWLHEEYEALRHWVREGTPLLGVCLGAQTLAHALGAQVSSAGTTLAGFYPSELTDEGVADPVLGVLPPRFEALNANAFRFEIPDGAIELARGPVPQGFRVDGSAWAVQFHPEVRRHQLLEWFRDDPALPKPLEALAAELDEKLDAWQEHGRRLCRAFLAVAG